MTFIDRFLPTSSDIAMDLGTANTVVYVRGRGIVLAEPSVVALQTVDGIDRVLAVGDDAKLMLGKTPQDIRAVRPLRNGVISDLEVAEQMIKHFIGKVRGSGRFLSSPEIIVCVPSNSTMVEQRAIRDAASNAGARRVWLIDECLAAALGADIPVCEPLGTMVVDIGGGTTEVGVIATGGLHLATSVRTGGDHMDEAIMAHVRRHHNMVIGEATAEHIKHDFGSALVPSDEDSRIVTVKGLDLLRGVPNEIEITTQEIAESLSESVAQIVEVVRNALESVAPEIAADIVETGIVMTGGGSLLADIDTVIAEATGLPVMIAQDPLNCVALGAGRALEDPSYRGVLQPV
ncbi:MAG: rod shape-determining protein [Novosphingobium sp.]|nr:rod shape-determining protein [Novosphingobium sp.]MCP5402550.1 rod shape-determining protein [Novosphingobium sp.]